MRRGLTVLITGLLLVAGCGEAPPASRTLDAGDLGQARGCGDAFLYRLSPEDDLAVIVRWRDAASRAAGEGGFTEQVTLPHADVDVRVQQGAYLSEGMCTDVVTEDRPVIDGEWTAVSGSVEIVVEPAEEATADWPLAHATVLLRDVELEPEGRARDGLWHIEELELPDVEVGWFPG